MTKKTNEQDQVTINLYVMRVRALGVPLIQDHEFRDKIGERLVEFADWIESEAQQ
jgi:hypothetical protein